MDDTFEFLKEYKNIYNYAINTQEAYEAADTIYKLGTFENELRKTTEAILNKLIKEYSLKADGELNIYGKIELLFKNRIIDKDSKSNFHTMRMEGNEGSHAGETMDTRKERSMYQERKQKADYLFKCLYVECYRFVNEYMPKSPSVSDKVSENRSQTSPSERGSVNNSNSHKVELEDVNVKESSTKQEETNSKSSSVTFGTVHKSNVFTQKKELYDYGAAKVGCKMFELLIIICATVYYIASKQPSDSEAISFIFICVLAFMALSIIDIPFYNKANRVNFYSGALDVPDSDYPLRISAQGIKGGEKIQITVAGRPVEVKDYPEKEAITRKDGTKAHCIAKCDTTKGYVFKIYKFYHEKYYPRFDVILNGRLVVEGEKINLDKLTEARRLVLEYMSDYKEKHRILDGAAKALIAIGKPLLEKNENADS